MQTGDKGGGQIGCGEASWEGAAVVKARCDGWSGNEETRVE